MTSRLRNYLGLVFRAISFTTIAMAGTGCTDSGLQPLPEPVQYVDDKLAVSGEFCTAPADPVAFPVKLLIVIDQSASLQCTDPGNNRLAALNMAGSALDPLPNVEFGVIGFASWSRITEFTTDWATAAEQLAPESGQGGPATDYQGALSTTLRVLEQDMVDSGPAEVSRTKYVVVFLSDGIPEPRCQAGCDDGDVPPDSLYGVCNTDQEIEDGYYVDMNSPCPEYNQPLQILQKVQDVVSLGDYYGAGDLTLSTILLFAPEEEIAEVCGDVSQFGYVKEEAMPLLQSMADEGGGTFRDVNISEELDFLDFDYESLEAPYELSSLFAINATAMPQEGIFGPDSDRDGLLDDLEFQTGLDRLSPDSDGDGFGDLIELSYLFNGFDPLDATIPTLGCSDSGDADGDGLRGCEEDFLGTNPLLPDTDGDRLHDGIELRFGLDPVLHDSLVDYDSDGRLSGLEVRTGTHPLYFDEEEALVDQLTYSVEPGVAAVDGVRCYDFEVRNLTLVPAMAYGDQGASGSNLVLVFAAEEPVGLAGSRGLYHVACVEARYLGDTYKDPPSGEITGLSAERFVPVQDFDPALHCLAVGDDPGAGLVGGGS